MLDRLAIVGNSGMGALTYHPAQEIENENTDDNLDDLAEQCEKILNPGYFRLTGAPGTSERKDLTGSWMHQEHTECIC